MDDSNLENVENQVNDSENVEVNEEQNDSAKTNHADDDYATQIAELQKRLSAADRARVSAENKLKKIDREKLDENERIRLERDEALAQVNSLQEAVTQRAIENAFLMNTNVRFHNPATALRLLDRSAISINEDGTVKGMDDAIAALAKSDPYLVKTEEVKKTGTTAPKTQGVKVENAARAALEKKYPSLRR